MVSMMTRVTSTMRVEVTIRSESREERPSSRDRRQIRLILSVVEEHSQTMSQMMRSLILRMK